MLQLPEPSVVALYAEPFNITVTVVPVARPLEPPLMVRSSGFLGIVNDVIAGDGVDGQRRAAEINGHIVSRAVAVARAIAQAGGDRLASGCQRRDIRRRNAHTPVT